MPTIVWILIWAALGATVAVLVFRERRAGKNRLGGDPGNARDQAAAELRMRSGDVLGDQLRQTGGGG